MKKCHEIDYQVVGEPMAEAAVITLDPGEICISESGAMLWMDPDIKMSATLTDGSSPNNGLAGKLFGAAKRMIAGESAVVVQYENVGKKRANVTFGAPFLGTMVGLNLNDVGGEIFLQRGAYIASAYGTSVSISFAGKPMGAFFGGEGLIFQSIKGDDVVVFHAGGSIIQKDLKPGEHLFVDSGSLVGYTKGIEFDAELSGGITNMLFSGEGIFNSKVTGIDNGGTVFLQTLPFSKLCMEISNSLPRKN
jgi:uncharacterized protein (AIM24 family)